MKTLYIFLLVLLPSGEPANVPYYEQFQVKPEICQTDTKFYIGPMQNLSPGYRVAYAAWCE